MDSNGRNQWKSWHSVETRENPVEIKAKPVETRGRPWRIGSTLTLNVSLSPRLVLNLVVPICCLYVRERWCLKRTTFEQAAAFGSHKGWNKQSCTCSIIVCYTVIQPFSLAVAGYCTSSTAIFTPRGLTLVPNQQWVALWKVPAASFSPCATLNTVSEMYNVPSLEHR